MVADNFCSLGKCFKDYDIRGKTPTELSPAFAYALGTALSRVVRPKKVIIGRDVRLSSPELAQALAKGLHACGVDAADAGLCGTEEIYFAAANGDFDLGVMITGSHNPANENGFKLVRRGAIPIGTDSGLKDIAAAAIDILAAPAPSAANFIVPETSQNAFSRTCAVRPAYLAWLLSHAEPTGRPLKIVADAGNGCAGPLLTQLAARLPHEIIPLHYEPDGSFPNGVPNPLLPDRREAASSAVLMHKADLGAAFDGDFDRCFFFDHCGRMVESCYLIGLLARRLLAGKPGAKIVHDARVYWLTRELVLAAGGQPVMSKGGHTRMKETMRAHNALYGAEMSAHHFYREFAFCDSGMLTFLLLVNVVAESGQSLAELVEAGIAKYPCSGELNFKVKNAPGLLEALWRHYAPASLHADRLDGINLEFKEWRFNLRSSNTEPLLRLNVESRGKPDLLAAKTEELSRLIRQE